MKRAAKKRVALFGGSFNPPHAAHQLVALYVLETQPVDELWFLPTFQHVFGKELAPFADRVAMTKLIAKPLGSRAKVSLAEKTLAHQPGFVGSRTYDLLQMLRREHVDIAFRWVIGTDILAETDKWHRWTDVVRMAPLIIVGRGGQMPPDSSAAGLTMPDVSSTEVRAALHEKRPLDALLPRSVLRYIAERRLYR
jgi:nicotinate-nucleotide adenylyltransferase